MIKKIVSIAVLLLFVSLVLASYADQDIKRINIQNPEDVVCNADNVREQIYDGCNWCYGKLVREYFFNLNNTIANDKYPLELFNCKN